MTHQFLLIPLATFVRALIAHACGEGLRLVLEHVAPGVPPPVCIVVGLLTGVGLVELVIAIWHRRNGPRQDSG
jgi:hypothetical protein